MLLFTAPCTVKLAVRKYRQNLFSRISFEKHNIISCALNQKLAEKLQTVSSFRVTYIHLYIKLYFISLLSSQKYVSISEKIKIKIKLHNIY